MEPAPEEVKENRSWALRWPVPARWVALGVAAATGALLLAGRIDRALPAARPPPPHIPADHFSGVLAHRHLVNLTSIGPRVAGSYENEVLGVGAVVAAARAAAASASPHNAVELDLHRASGAFSLTFFDGMNNVYRDVQSVVVRVRGRGDPPRAPPHARPRRSALLLNCHFDTVPDSPGASDDGAGCAVVLETLRALSATPRPLRHDAIFLLNGAEENIMQASHAFVTTHKWAESVRAFINVEACGAGGRAVLFQSGPRDPWLLERFALVPRPFGSSLAQELFESGLVPADTDFRIFRDWGGASGVDLAWSARGYVYHTPLDTAARAPPAALQHTGDNVLAFAHALLSSPEMEQEADAESRMPVFFDVLGVWMPTARAPAAVALAAVALLLTASAIHADARAAHRDLYIGASVWWWGVCRALVAVCAGCAAGVGAAAGAGAALHAAGARMRYYNQPALLALTHALPALSASWAVVRWRMRAPALRVGGAGGAGGWHVARLAAGGVVAGWALLLLACVVRALRSGFIPLLWTLSLAAAHRVAHLTRAKEGAWVAWWCAGAALPLLQTAYLANSCIEMFVPVTGRAGTTLLPPDVMMGVLTGALTLAACSWLLPLVAACASAQRLAAALALVSILTVLALMPASPLSQLAPPYAADRPQRYMVFHTRITTHHAQQGHAQGGQEEEALSHSDHYWLPHLDANTPASLKDHVPEIAAAGWEPERCVQWPYCGAPYFLPVLRLIGRGYWLPAPAPPTAPASAPPVTVTVRARTAPINSTLQLLTIDITGPSHVVVIVSPAAGVAVPWCDALAGPPLKAAPWGDRDTYFFSLHDAAAEGKGGSAPASWSLSLQLSHAFGPHAPPHWATLSVAGHGMARARAPAHQALFDRMPPWVAATGWGVHLHLLHV